MIYYIFLFLLGLSAIIYGVSPDRRKLASYRTLSIFFFFLFIFVGGFRYEVGADWEPYSIFFSDIKTWDDVLSSRMEKIYELMVLIFNKLDLSYVMFVPTIFTLSFFVKYKVFQRYSSNIFLSLVIYFYTVFIIYDMNGIRQGMALALSLYSIRFIVERDFKLFLLTSIIALGFHTSSVFFIPAYWLYDINQRLTNTKTLLLIGIVVILAIPLRVILKDNVLEFLIADDLLNHYSTYSSGDYNVDSSIISMGTIQRLIILFIYIYSINIVEDSTSQFEMFLARAYFTGIVIFVFFSFSMEYAARLSFCYKFLEVLMIPIAVQKMISVKKKLIVFFVVISFSAISIYQYLSLPEHGYLLPYQNQIVNCFMFY